MTHADFESRLGELRPRLHRYCARMTGSAIDGEDMLQDTLVKALRARADGVEVENLEAWLMRIAHHTCLDFLRARSRRNVVPLTDEVDASLNPDPEIASASFRLFAQLPELQRCAVILKDVLGHSVEEVASIAGCTPAAAKSALQRGRASLKHLAQAPGDMRLPLMYDAERDKMTAYADRFRAGDFDTIRAMLAEDVKLELVNRLRLEGREKIGLYFTRYGEETKWRFAFGAVEGRPAMLVFDAAGAGDKPAHFVLIGWQENRIAAIRDFLFSPYVMDGIDWVRLA